MTYPKHNMRFYHFRHALFQSDAHTPRRLRSTWRQDGTGRFYEPVYNVTGTSCLEWSSAINAHRTRTCSLCFEECDRGLTQTSGGGYNDWVVTVII